MITLVLVLSVILATVAFLVTEENADSSLSGYNTLSSTEKQQFDIKAFVPYFRKFHLSLAVSYLLISLFLLFAISSYWAKIFSIAYPLLAYIFFIWKANSFFIKRNKKQYILSITVICFLLIVLLVIMIQFLES
ncbi:DUF3784 domain-containing protein [Sphingobacterium detergens]|uniref:Uncharacterized protein DUF3784 n=1 Tax=Sphingobacterium detergens TaxID=1145106 RepID=A0A420B7M0_SPHD1|nr:DUF3784 domain-containing protein [Sphingobacterium detergens]RKE52659.1 uncharacterized protein DUF3784 [Sphingobacterium detergens]